MRGGVVCAAIAALWVAPIAACSYDSTSLIFADNCFNSFSEGGAVVWACYVEQSLS
jgi:hypothetical protein